ncbi:MAG TPA: hypothetical protein VFS34_06675 [Thermoanaerobaculia bacterium]|nr:hypothetical protein [Thermoanaerobaculia bacterium]
MKIFGVAAAALVCLSRISSAGGVNLVSNADFAGSLATWTSSFATFDGLHSATADGTGSALGSFTLPNNAAYGNANGLTQCIAGIVPGTTYFFGGKVLIPGNQTGTGGGSIAIQWYSSTTCTGFITNDSTPIAITPTDATDVWHFLQGNQAAPGGAGSVLVIGEIQNNSGAGNAFAVNFDEIFLQTTPPVPPVSVPVIEWPALALLAASVAAVGILRLNRSS